MVFELAPIYVGEPYFSWIVLGDHLFDVFSVYAIDMFWASHLSVVFTINFGEDVTSVGRSSFDLAIFFDFEALDSTFYALHFRHILTPLIDFFIFIDDRIVYE